MYRGAHRQRHAPRTGLRHWRPWSRAGPGGQPHPRAWTPDDHPHPLGSHPRVSVLRAALQPRQRVGHLRSRRARAAARADPGRTDGVHVLSGHAEAARGRDPLPRPGRGELRSARRARRHQVPEPSRARPRLPAGDGLGCGRLRLGSRAPRAAAHGGRGGRATRPQRGPPPRRVSRRCRPRHPRRAVRPRRVPRQDRLGSHAGGGCGRLCARRARPPPRPVPPRSPEGRRGSGQRCSRSAGGGLPRRGAGSRCSRPPRARWSSWPRAWVRRPTPRARRWRRRPARGRTPSSLPTTTR